MPTSAAEKAPEMASLINDIEAGVSTNSIIRKNPKFAFRSRDIDALRVQLTNEEYKYKNRPIEVVYLWGEPGTGKTRSIYEQHGAENVYRITDYPRSGLRFDGYNRSQDVLVFEEFYSDKVPINQMLNLLDIYPLELPARYDNKVACYTKIYIVSNIPLEQQYKFEQKEMPATWTAFRRRIHRIEHMTKKEESWTQQTLDFDSKL